MLSVAVHKDIGEYTEKVVGKLSARTLACTAGGLASSVATAAALNLTLGVPVDAATLPVMAASMPFWLMGFWRPKGLTAERYLAMLARHALSDGVLVYSTGSRPWEAAGESRAAGGPQGAQEEQEKGGPRSVARKSRERKGAARGKSLERRIAEQGARAHGADDGEEEDAPRGSGRSTPP